MFEWVEPGVLESFAAWVVLQVHRQLIQNPVFNHPVPMNHGHLGVLCTVEEETALIQVDDFLDGLADQIQTPSLVGLHEILF